MSTRTVRRCLAAGLTATILLAALPAALTPLAAIAAPTHSKMAPAAPVYACKECRLYYPASAAKNMGYRDPMGHRLTKMAKIPAGYRNGAAASGKMNHMAPMSPMSKMDSSKMGSKMDKMAGDKK